MKAMLDKTPSLRTLVRWTAGPVLGLVFIAAAYSKAVDPRETIRALIWLFPETPSASHTLVRVLIVGELMLGAILVAGVAGKAAFAVALLALGAFSGWIIYLMAAGVEIGCGCGLSAESTWLSGTDARWAALVRNSILAGVSVLGMASRVASPRVSANPSQLVDTSDGLSVRHSFHVES